MSLKARGIVLPKYNIDDPDSVAVWTQASLEFAENARGNVTVLTNRDSVKVNSVWRQEYKALTQNPNVTSITAVNPTTGDWSLLWGVPS